MFQFEHPEYLWLAVLLPLALLLYLVRSHLAGKDLHSWASESSLRKIRTGKTFRPAGMWMGWVILVLLILAAANPQRGYRTVSVENTSADIYLLFDISNSMLAEDIPPSRLERARRFALDLSTAFRSDKVGLILFAGNAYIQSPLTLDWNAIQLYLGAAHPDQAGTQGTAIGEAVRKVLKASGSGKLKSQGAIIIITDGESHDQDAPQAIEEAYQAGWTTYVIGVGTANGSTIPIAIDGRKDVKRDGSGQPVVTALNEALMKSLASAGGGKYFDLALQSSIVESLTEELSMLERTQREMRSFSEHKSYFQWFLLPGILLLLTWVGMNYKFEVI